MSRIAAELPTVPIEVSEALPRLMRYSVDCVAPVGSAPLGAGRWGHLDLVGNMFQRLLDGDGTYVNPCIDCSRIEGTTYGAVRGAGFDNAARDLFSPARSYLVPNYRSHRVGLRCARTP